MSSFSEITDGMTDLVAIQGSEPVEGPKLDFFTSPPTDVSQLSYRHVPITPFTTGITPVDFQVDPRPEFIDFSRSYVQMESTLKKHGGDNIAAGDALYPANNLAHTLFRQVNIKLNGTLISPQTDTYHYKAYLETLLNNDIDDAQTVLAPQGWFNGCNAPLALTANNIDSGTPDAAWTALPDAQKEFITNSKEAKGKFVGGT